MKTPQQQDQELRESIDQFAYVATFGLQGVVEADCDAEVRELIITHTPVNRQMYMDLYEQKKLGYKAQRGV